MTNDINTTMSYQKKGVNIVSAPFDFNFSFNFSRITFQENQLFVFQETLGFLL